MNVKNIEKEAVRAKVTVEITRAELEPAINKVYLKVRKDISMPGFRKGKAPRMVIEAAYGKHVFFEDAIERMCSVPGHQARRQTQRFQAGHCGR